MSNHALGIHIGDLEMVHLGPAKPNPYTANNDRGKPTLQRPSRQRVSASALVVTDLGLSRSIAFPASGDFRHH